MISMDIIAKARKVIIWIAVGAVAFFGVIAVISLVISWGVLAKPMRYKNVVPEIRLAPGERKVFEFEAFCLDNGRGSPRAGDDYSLMSTPAIKLRPYLKEIFDEYLAHPSRWKQSDVQQAVWYTEGRRDWASLTPEQKDFIKTATGREDPVSGHPVIFLNRMAQAFGVVVKTNLGLALIVFFSGCVDDVATLDDYRTRCFLDGAGAPAAKACRKPLRPDRECRGGKQCAEPCAHPCRCLIHEAGL